MDEISRAVGPKRSRPCGLQLVPVGACHGRFNVMVVPLLSPSGSLLAVDAYVEEAFTTPVTVNTDALVDRLREKSPSVQTPSAAVTQVSVPAWWLNVPLTVAPATGVPLESNTVAVTFGCHLFRDEAAMEALSRSPT